MRLGRLLARVPALGWVISGLVVAGLVAWPLGGWDTVTVTSRVIPTYASGETLEGHRFALTVGDIEVTDRSPAGRDADEGTEFLVLHVQVLNITNEPTGPAPLDGLVVPDDPRLDDVFVNYTLALDGTSTPELNPGLARQIDFVWTVDAGTFSAGDVVAFTLRDSIPRKAVLFRGIAWGDYFVAGTAERVVGA